MIYIKLLALSWVIIALGILLFTAFFISRDTSNEDSDYAKP